MNKLSRKTLTPDECEAFEERAAILEFDGKTTRSAAEKLALEEIQKMRKAKELRLEN